MSFEKRNYFVVSRDMLHSDRWLCEKFTTGQAWVDLFGLAQHSDSYFNVRGIRVYVERGQLAYSQLTLSKRWRWSRDKTRRFLKRLENDGDIIQQNNEVTTIITIRNYDIWQLEIKENKTTDQTTEKHQKNIKQDTYNKINNDKNISGNTLVCSALPALTPKEETNKFFLEVKKIKAGEKSDWLMCKVQELSANIKVPVEPITAEIVKFYDYWTELNQTGTKQRWQLERTFEVKRRMAYWFSHAKDFKRSSSPAPASTKLFFMGNQARNHFGSYQAYTNGRWTDIDPKYWKEIVDENKNKIKI